MKYIVLLLVLLVVSTNSQTSYYQVNALTSFYNSTGGKYWLTKTNWNSGYDPCGTTNKW